jgi:uncharacterized glyoxalase superfamily metalloenzyme YdcJ
MSGKDVGEPREEKIAFIDGQLATAFPDLEIRQFKHGSRDQGFAIENDQQQQFLIATYELFRDVDIAGIAKRLPPLIEQLKDGETEVWLKFDPTR